MFETWSLTLREERRPRVFENRVLRRIFGPERDEVTGEWRKLHSEELNDMYLLPSNIGVIKAKIMRWAVRLLRIGKKGGVFRVLAEKPEEREHLEDPGIDGRIILRWIFRKGNVRVWNGLSWLRIETYSGHL
jgi:hypothetical protein